jgi:serine/threonine-protein kinase
VDSRVGTAFGKYDINRLLGKGGMGAVYEAYDTAKNRTVALKILAEELSHDDTFRTRFQRESHAAAILQEPHVIPIHDWGEIDGNLYIDMRFVDGQTLHDLLQRGPLPPARAVAIVSQVAAALDAAHAAGLIHRDIKPQNILVTPADFAYLVDFGIAETGGASRLTRTGTQIGTVNYMAPERFSDQASTPSVDVYALTCVLFEALIGYPPFDGPSLERLLLAHISSPPPRPSTADARVPPGFDDVITRGMAKDPDDRFGTAGGLGRAAQRALQTGGQTHSNAVTARTPSGPSTAPTGPPVGPGAAPVPPNAPTVFAPSGPPVGPGGPPVPPNAPTVFAAGGPSPYMQPSGPTVPHAPFAPPVAPPPPVAPSFPPPVAPPVIPPLAPPDGPAVAHPKPDSGGGRPGWVKPTVIVVAVVLVLGAIGVVIGQLANRKTAPVAGPSTSTVYRTAEPSSTAGDNAPPTNPRPSPPPPPASPPPLVSGPDSSSMHQTCDQGFTLPNATGFGTHGGRGTPETSCLFANSVLTAYWATYGNASPLPRAVSAPGAVACTSVPGALCNGANFLMQCQQYAGDGWITCTGGNNARVYLW